MDGRIARIKLSVLPDNPVVSIIVPSYNQGDYIKKTVDSILGQDYRPLELIIVDGASRDKTLEVLKSYGEIAGLRYISEPDNGVADAVNKGFNMAGGDILAVQSSDDHYLPGAVSRMVEAFREYGTAGIIYGDIVKIDENDTVLTDYSIKPFSLEDFLSCRTWIPQPAAFFRRELLDELGGWNGEYYCCDTEFWLRGIFRTEVVKVDKLISRRLMHPGQRDENGKKITEAYRNMIDNSVDIKKLPLRLRKAAECGKWMTCFRYNGGNDWGATYFLWKAIFSDPSIAGHIGFTGHLIPGYIPLRKRLSWIKRNIFKINPGMSGRK